MSGDLTEEADESVVFPNLWIQCVKRILVMGEDEEDTFVGGKHLSPEEFQTAWDYNVQAASEIHKIMVESLRKGGVD